MKEKTLEDLAPGYNRLQYPARPVVNRNKTRENRHVSRSELARAFDTLIAVIEYKVDKNKRHDACDLLFDLRRLLEK